jgi:hypothetical protein
VWRLALGQGHQCLSFNLPNHGNINLALGLGSGLADGRDFGLQDGLTGIVL